MCINLADDLHVRVPFAFSPCLLWPDGWRCYQEWYDTHHAWDSPVMTVRTYYFSFVFAVFHHFDTQRPHFDKYLKYRQDTSITLQNTYKSTSKHMQIESKYIICFCGIIGALLDRVDTHTSDLTHKSSICSITKWRSIDASGGDLHMGIRQCHLL